MINSSKIKSSIFNLKSLILLCLILFFIEGIQARHIVGGDITVQRILPPINSTDAIPRYRVLITMYRDCDQEGISDLTDFDPNPLIGIHRRVNGEWQLYRSQNVPRSFSSGQPVAADDDPCVELPPELCVDFNQYEFITELPLYDDSYLISYQRCCRNNTVSNIIDPGGTGIAFTYELTPESQSLGNSSPVFKRFPPILICANRPFFFDHSATDEDGDQLFYEFCNPLAAGGDNTSSPTLCTGTTPDPGNCLPPYDRVTFRQPTYSAENPIPGQVDFTIDPNTGLIRGTPDVQGQYVVGICVREFRDGQLLSTVRRDVQLNVSTCNFPEARIEGMIESGNRYVLVSCGENTVDFKNLSPAEFAPDGYYWEFDIGGTISSSNDRDVTFTFPEVGSYDGFMVVNPNTQCADTALINTRILPALSANFTVDYDSCVAGVVEFDARSSTTQGPNLINAHMWEFGDDSTGTQEQTTHLYATPGQKEVKLTVTDNNGCMNTFEKIVDYSPVPQTIVVQPNTFRGCLPADVFFNNLSMPIDSTYFIEWDFGDGNTSNAIKPTHTYETEGVYSVSVKIVSPLNCEVDRTFSNWIRVEESPTADFSFDPPFPSVFDRSIQFTDESLGAISWQWDFSGEGSAFEPNPNYTFPDTGFQKIDLVVRHVSGCTDTATQIIDIRPESNFFMPNAFTPNMDATNDEFKGVGYTEGISEFTMTIWGRWGEQVFETNNPLEGWNGRKDNVGNNLPNGVYVYLVTYNDPRNRPQKLKGFATLIR